MKSNQTDNLFLPNFCAVYSVFLSIIVMELLAFVLVLVPLSKTGYNWNYVQTNFITDLAMISLFIQWITLVSIGLLCVIRRWLKPLKNNFIIGIISYLLILLVTWLVSEFAWHIQEYVAFTDFNHNSTHQLFLWRNLAISAIISAIALRYFYVQHQWQTETEANAYARAQALQARIRPHFLFNSMNTIASLIRFQPQKAEQVVEDFADLFRASLLDAKMWITFSEELTLGKQYLGIEALRLGNRLQIIWNLDIFLPNDALLPPLCLQPLLENAVYHGIQPLPEGGEIQITGLFDGKRITISIINPLADLETKSQGNRMAQQNIQQRLHFFYGSTAKLKIHKEINLYHAELSFPYLNKPPLLVK